MGKRRTLAVAEVKREVGKIVREKNEERINDKTNEKILQLPKFRTLT